MFREKSNRLKRTFFVIVAVAMGLITGLLLFELVVARLYYSNVCEISNKNFDSLLGWRLKPGTYWIKSPISVAKHPVYINRNGLRNREITVPGQKHVQRIIVLGDSFTYAVNCRDESIFTTRLERYLNSRRQCQPSEVINAGVPGYGTAQELLLLRDLTGSGIVGDVYVLMMYTNDILDNLCLTYGKCDRNEIQPRFEVTSSCLVLRNYPKRDNERTSVHAGRKSGGLKTVAIVRTRLQAFVQTRPKLVNLLNRFGVKAEFARIPGLINGWYRKGVLKDGVPLMRALLIEIKQETSLRGAPLLVCIIPSPLQVHSATYGPLLERTFPSNEAVKSWLEDPQRPQRIISQICDEIDVPFLDLYPALHTTAHKALFIPGEGHLSEAGHEVVARSMADFFLD